MPGWVCPSGLPGKSWAGTFLAALRKPWVWTPSSSVFHPAFQRNRFLEAVSTQLLSSDELWTPSQGKQEFPNQWEFTCNCDALILLCRDGKHTWKQTLGLTILMFVSFSTFATLHWNKPGTADKHSHLKAKLFKAPNIALHKKCKTVFRHVSNYMSEYKNKWCVQVDKVLIEREFCKSW